MLYTLNDRKQNGIGFYLFDLSRNGNQIHDEIKCNHKNEEETAMVESKNIVDFYWDPV